MELRKHFNLKSVFAGLYILAFVIYIAFGLQPVEATNYKITSEISIPSINLMSDVTVLDFENNELNTPGAIVGSYSRVNNKTLLIGHSTTVFKDLALVKLNSTINYDNKTYRVVEREVAIKSRIDMEKLLSEEVEDTIVLMTCAGDLIGNGDATHRLMLTAKIVD